MTRISLDVDAAATSMNQLALVQQAMGDAVDALMRPHLGLFPPAVLAHVVAEQASLAGGLRAGQGAIVAGRAELALRTALFIAAGGGGMDAHVAQAIRASLLPHVGGVHLSREQLSVLERGLDTLHGIGKYVDANELFMFGLVRFAERDVPRSLKTSWHWFNKEFDPLVKGRVGGGVLLGVGAVVATIDGYRHSAATTTGGRATSAVLGGAAETLFSVVYPGPAIVDSFLPDKFKLSRGLEGGMDAVVLVGGLLTGNDAGAAQFSADALAGKKGIYVQAIAHVGDSLGGTLYDVGSSVNSAIHHFKRPGWLGG